jgi:hypothetical protein
MLHLALNYLVPNLLLFGSIFILSKALERIIASELNLNDNP